jgi:hypothetical protein
MSNIARMLSIISFPHQIIIFPKREHQSFNLFLLKILSTENLHIKVSSLHAKKF